MVLFMSQSITFVSHICRIVQIAETKLQCVCERLRRVGDRFMTHAMSWRLFCDDFCCNKKVLHVILFGEPFATSLRCMRGLCDPMQTFQSDEFRD